MDLLAQLSRWSPRRWVAAAVATALTMLVIAIPTDMFPNPFFTRSMDVTWWSYPVLVANALLSGLLIATYVKEPGPVSAAAGDVSPAPRLGMVGTFATVLAVGCPVCNKVVVLALGVSGAMTWFAPLQPVLAGAALVMLVWAFRARLRGEAACRLPPPPADRAESLTPFSKGGE